MAASEPTRLPVGGVTTNPELLTAPEALARLRRATGGRSPSKPTFYQALNDGDIAGFRIGSRWYVNRRELERLIREGRAPLAP